MSKEKNFFDSLQNIFVGIKVEGISGFINLMKIKSGYYSQIEKILRKDIDNKIKNHFSFKEELFVKNLAKSSQDNNLKSQSKQLSVEKS